MVHTARKSNSSWLHTNMQYKSRFHLGTDTLWSCGVRSAQVEFISGGAIEVLDQARKAGMMFFVKSITDRLSNRLANKALAEVEGTSQLS